MKKLLFIIIALSFCLSGCGNNNENSTDNNETNTYYYNSSRTTASDNTNNYKINNTDINANNNTNNTNNNEISESELSSFSTKIYTPNDKARQHNIQITCSKLNGTIVKPGETFSFCNTVGKATPEAGYEKADVYDSNGNVVKGYGGGNCQISSTLYNAVLALPNLGIVERHEHSKKVYYVPERKRRRCCLW